MRVLPLWNDAMSDGCSVPEALRRVLPFLAEVPRRCAACLSHDAAYYYGGTEQDRADADERLRVELIEAGVRWWKARLCWAAVRLFGGPALHRFTQWACGSAVAWANGGGFYEYGERAIGASL